MKIKVNNVPDYAKNYKYIVYREASDRSFWFWGAFDDAKEAFRIAKEIDGALCSVTDDL